MDDLFTDAARRLLGDQCTPRAVRAIEAEAASEAGRSGPASASTASALWTQLAEAGFADALVPEAQGGSGLALAQVFGIWEQAGAHALPLPLADTMLARALLAAGGQVLPDSAAGGAMSGPTSGHMGGPSSGPIALAPGRLDDDGSLLCPQVPMGHVARAVLVQHAGGWQLLPTEGAQALPAAFALDAGWRWPAARLAELAREHPCFDMPGPAHASHGAPQVRTLQACAQAAQLSGLLMAVFQRTLQFANERQQFGRPIGKFQAIQHQLAVMSEHVFAARMAAQIGCSAGSTSTSTSTSTSGSGSGSTSAWPDPLRAAIAKARSSEAALAVAELAHAIHGAIGFTEEFDLQLFTRRLHHGRAAAGSESHWHEVAGAALLRHPGLALDLIREATDVAG